MNLFSASEAELETYGINGVKGLYYSIKIQQLSDLRDLLPDNLKSGIKISLDTDLAYSYGKTENLAMEEFLKFTR